MSDSLGDVYDPLGAHLDDPYPFYTQARRATPIFFSPVLQAWVVTRMADVRKVLRDGETFSSANVLRPFSPLSPEVYAVLAQGYPYTTSMITVDGEEHRRQRAPQAAGLSPESVAAAEPYIVKRATALVDGFAADGRTEFMGAYANPLPVSVICHLMGFEPEDHEQIGDDSRAAASLGMGHRFQSEQEQVDAAQSWVRFQHTIGRYVRDRWAAPRADIISEMIAAFGPGDGPLTADKEAALANIVFGITLPGHITTSALLGNGLLRLLRSPEQWRLLCERPDLIPNAVEEIARYDTPTHIFLRITTKETTVAGQRLPDGAEVAVWLAAANRDETAFERAEEFDVTREPQPHVVFGHGAHFCLGAGLARREVEVSLRVLTDRLPGLRLVPDQRIAFRPSLDHRGPLSLQVTW
ncbi:MAG TPA: cytochrome P450 [Streptosporangiaceae bacterium]|jgi:cytochrome P450